MMKLWLWWWASLLIVNKLWIISALKLWTCRLFQRFLVNKSSANILIAFHVKPESFYIKIPNQVVYHKLNECSLMCGKDAFKRFPLWLICFLISSLANFIESEQKKETVFNFDAISLEFDWKFLEISIIGKREIGKTFT